MKKAPDKAAASKADGLPKSDVNVSARLFHACAMFAAVRDIRYYLNSVYVEAGPTGGAVLCASNGHQMALAFDPAGTAPKDGCIIELTPALKAAAARAGHNGSVLIVGDRVRVYDSLKREAFIKPGSPLIEAHFPDWERVMPPLNKVKSTVSGTWNAGLIDRLGMAGRYLAGRGFTGMTHWQEPAQEVNGRALQLGPILTRYTIEPYFVAITMPFRSDSGSDSVPDFLAPAIAARKLRTDARRKADAEAKAANAAAASADKAVAA